MVGPSDCRMADNGAMSSKFVEMDFQDDYYTSQPGTLVNKDFVQRGKISFSDVFLDAEFKYVSRISLSPTSFAAG